MGNVGVSPTHNWPFSKHNHCQFIFKSLSVEYQRAAVILSSTCTSEN